MKRILLTASLFVALLVVAACGGSDEEPLPTPTDVPAVVEEAEPEVVEPEESEPEAEEAEEAVPSDDGEAGEAEEAVAENNDAEADAEADVTAEEAEEAVAENNDTEADAEADAEIDVTVDEAAQSDDAGDAEEAGDAAENDDSEADAETDTETDATVEEDTGVADEIEASAAQSAEITVLMNDLYFGETNDNLTNPPVWTVSSGQEVNLNMQNQSAAVEHSWVIVKQGAEISVPYNEETDAESLLFDSGVVPVDSEQTTTFTAPDIGEYLVICTVPGHSVIMQGQLVVE